MAHFEDHCSDCELILGNRHEEVNHWIDELFRQFGPSHRKFRHHEDGVNQAQRKFGGDAWKAAVVHIVRDCGYVPKETDYLQPSGLRSTSPAMNFADRVMHELVRLKDIYS